MEINSWNFNFEKVWIIVSLKNKWIPFLALSPPSISWSLENRFFSANVFEHVLNIYFGQTHQGGYTPMVDQPVHRPPPCITQIQMTLLLFVIHSWLGGLLQNGVGGIRGEAGARRCGKDGLSPWRGGAIDLAGACAVIKLPNPP